jgi:DNA-binding LacI/PurR family transcriptional regulator
MERFYTIKDIARLWGVAPGLARKAFNGREGVMRMGDSIRSSWRVPASLLLEVMCERGYRPEQAAKVLWQLERTL